MIVRARLWLSYQRYGLALVGAPVAAVAVAAVLAPWWAALVVGLVAIAPVRFGVEVLGRWPRKLRATRVSLGRIAAGRFRAEHVRSYCGDPCFRVVANEILTRAGIPRAERRRVVARFREELRRERDVLVLIDHVRGTVITFGGNAEERPTR